MWVCPVTGKECNGKTCVGAYCEKENAMIYSKYIVNFYPAYEVSYGKCYCYGDPVKVVTDTPLTLIRKDKRKGFYSCNQNGKTLYG